MKKTILLTFWLTISVLINAQNLTMGHYLAKKPILNSTDLRGVNKNMAVLKNTTTTNSGWFNYGLTVQDVYAVTSDYSTNYLFPDSTAYGEFGAGNFAPIWVHHLAEVIDFRSFLFQFNPNTSWMYNNPNSPIKIDSLSIVYGYTRTQTNVTDTLIITIFDGYVTTPGAYAPDGILNLSSNYPGGADTISYKRLGYNQLENVIASASNTTTVPSGQKIYKILLTQLDTAVTNLREKAFAFPLPFISNSSKIVCANIQFKPGYNNYLTEHVNYTANVFSFASLEENGNGGGTGTYMNYNDCGFGSALCDYSQSYIVHKLVRYNQVSSWNSRFLPAFAFTAPYAFEHHLISFHASNDMTNICLANSQFSVFPDSINPGSYSAYNNSSGTGIVSYLWDFGDGTTSSLPYPAHQYAVPGQYVICLTTSATSGTVTCSDTYCDSSSVQKMAAGFLMSQFNVIAPIVTNINETEKSIEIKAYPNPISDELVIEFTHKESEKLNYVLIDALGRVVLSNSFEKDKTTINTSQLSKGFYNLNIINTDGNKIKSLKIIK
jgi:hypothetical protein